MDQNQNQARLNAARFVLVLSVILGAIGIGTINFVHAAPPTPPVAQPNTVSTRNCSMDTPSKPTVVTLGGKRYVQGTANIYCKESMPQVKFMLRFDGNPNGNVVFYGPYNANQGQVYNWTITQPCPASFSSVYTYAAWIDPGYTGDGRHGTIPVILYNTSASTAISC